MILKSTMLKVADNCGLNYGKCIKLYGGFNQRYSNLGDNILIIAKIMRKHRRKWMHKKKFYTGIISNVKNFNRRNDGSYIKFDKNRMIIFTNNIDYKFLGTRIKGCISKEVFLKKGFIERIKKLSKTAFL